MLFFCTIGLIRIHSATESSILIGQKGIDWFSISAADSKQVKNMLLLLYNENFSVLLT